MNALLKTLPLAVLLLCSAAPWQPLAAQISVAGPISSGPLPPDTQTKLLPPADILTASPNRVYIGSLTRTGPAGQVTTGNVILSVTPQGSVRANLTYNGHVHPYYGIVQPEASSPRDKNGTAKHRTGTLAITRLVDHPTTPGVVEFFVENLALTVTQHTAYGGTTSGKGTVTFTARRFGVELSANPGGGITLPVSTGGVGSSQPVGTVTGTGSTGG